MGAKGFEELRVWRIARELARHVHGAAAGAGADGTAASGVEPGGAQAGGAKQ